MILHVFIYKIFITVFKNDYIMGFKGRNRRYAFGGSVLSISCLTFLGSRNIISSLRIGVLSGIGLGYLLCPEIYNALL